MAIVSNKISGSLATQWPGEKGHCWQWHDSGSDGGALVLFCWAGREFSEGRREFAGFVVSLFWVGVLLLTMAIQRLCIPGSNRMTSSTETVQPPENTLHSLDLYHKAGQKDWNCSFQEIRFSTKQKIYRSENRSPILFCFDTKKMDGKLFFLGNLSMCLCQANEPISQWWVKTFSVFSYPKALGTKWKCLKDTFFKGRCRMKNWPTGSFFREVSSDSCQTCLSKVSGGQFPDSAISSHKFPQFVQQFSPLVAPFCGKQLQGGILILISL